MLCCDDVHGHRYACLTLETHNHRTPTATNETGVALAKDKVTAPAGFQTPASALGDLLIERLQRRNILFKVDA